MASGWTGGGRANGGIVLDHGRVAADKSGMAVVVTASESSGELVITGELDDVVVDGAIDDVVTDGALVLPSDDLQDATNTAAAIVVRCSHRLPRMRARLPARRSRRNVDRERRTNSAERQIWRVSLDLGKTGGMAEHVNVDNFVRAETNRMFAGLYADAGGVNTWFHHRTPASVDHQTVIRMNRDTLYSFAVVDISDGATLTVPEHGDRYVSVMIVNQDHYINEIFHDPGVYELSVDRHETPYVFVAARVLVDPNDPNDLSCGGRHTRRLSD